MSMKKKVPQKAILEENNEEEVVTDESQRKPVPENPEEINKILENWPQLQKLLGNDLTVDDLFEKGWKPYIKTKTGGQRYITIRIHGKDDSGKMIEGERSLGAYNDETAVRYDILMSLYPRKELPELAPENSPEIEPPAPIERKASVLTTKVGKVAPIGPTVQIKLGTLQWFTWVQQTAGYPGTLDDFINESVETLFREHFKLQLAVILKET